MAKAKYLFVESDEGNDYLKAEFEQYTSKAQREQLWGALREESDKDSEVITGGILRSVEVLANQDFTIAAYELDEDTVEAFYSRDLIDYDADKARGFIRVD